MTVSELFDMFLAGRQLPNLASNHARALLDLARSKLLSRGIKTAVPAAGTDLKTALIDAHKMLTGAEFYASAGENPLAGLTSDAIDRVMARHRETGESILQLVGEETGHMPARPAPATPPAPQTPQQRARIAELERKLAAKDAHLARLAARAAQLAAAPARPAPARPAPAAARPAPVRPAPTPAPAPASFAAKMTAGAAREIAKALLDEQEARRIASLTKTRAVFSAMPAREQAAFCKAGGKITP